MGFQSNPAALRRANAPVSAVSTLVPTLPIIFSSPSVIPLHKASLVEISSCISIVAVLPLGTAAVVTSDGVGPG